MYGNNCYQIHGESNACDPVDDSDNVDCLASWQDANKRCASLGGALAAIHDKYYNGKFYLKRNLVFAISVASSDLKDQHQDITLKSI